MKQPLPLAADWPDSPDVYLMADRLDDKTQDFLRTCLGPNLDFDNDDWEYWKEANLSDVPIPFLDKFVHELSLISSGFSKTNRPRADREALRMRLLEEAIPRMERMLIKIQKHLEMDSS